MNSNILSFNKITKTFPGVVALEDVSIQFHKGEVHAIVGENGAGKSTLIKILSGAHRPSSGSITLFDNEYSFQSHYTPQESISLGVSVIYQEFNLIPYLSVAENVFFGKENVKGIFVDKKLMERETERICKDMGIELNVGKKVKDLSVAYQQIVEIVKSLSSEAKILVMDEPTAPLTNKEIDSLFKIVRKLKEKGVTILYVSHRLEEVFEICDRVTVMRDGKYVTTKNTSDVTKKELIGYMIGRELKDEFPAGTAKSREVVLEAQKVTTSKIKDLSFKLYKGEILGFGGLVGSGRTEAARAIFGADRLLSGELSVFGKKQNISCPSDAIERGVCLLPEDRKQHGLILSMQIKENVTYSILDKLTKFGFIKQKAEKDITVELKEKLKIKAPKISMLAKNLSGGNQQKVVLAKWLATKSDILIFDEPTRGIDVGAKQEIYHLMRRLAEEGKSIIMISSEMPELIGMSDRIIVMNEGRIRGVLEREDFSQERILEVASL